MSNKKILLVDDDREAAELVKRYLLKNQLTVYWAQNGTEAVQIYETHHPDLVLLDIMMPGVDGFVTLRKIRSLEASSGKKAVIIMLTAKGSTEDVLNAIKQGANDYLVKPVTEERLVAKLNKYLSSQVKPL